MHCGYGGKTVYRDLMRFWIRRLLALGFVMGIVTGVVLSYRSGAKQGGFSWITGNVIGPRLIYEALSAFSSAEPTIEM
jgi:cytochrome bd-type quinol oxidase subunit 1